ncbi:uncharacterized protein [Rutidosis leptorrhynchoides]|uniref:uncharacterized protein n=1 Tax=Rutidosis leptorrhynchoides TaxID=125765 RepID=UPI003A993645
MWEEYGIEKTMMNAKGYFFFKFATTQGMQDVLENSSWMIKIVPIILKKWSANVSLTKEDLRTVHVWVKLHDVPLTCYIEDGLSIIASKIGNPIMLESYTSTMCVEAWGWPNYARAMLKVSAEHDHKKSIKVATLRLDGDGKSIDSVTIKYEWNLPRCSDCKVF